MDTSVHQHFKFPALPVFTIIETTQQFYLNKLTYYTVTSARKPNIYCICNQSAEDNRNTARATVTKRRSTYPIRHWLRLFYYEKGGCCNLTFINDITGYIQELLSAPNFC